MLAVVKTPHTEIRIKGRIPKRLMAVLRHEYGSKVRLVSEAEEEKVDIFQTDWYRSIKAKMTPGKNLRVYRQIRGMTQSELGTLLGDVPRQHVSNMESGSRPISKKMALRLAAIFDTSVEKFIG